MLGGYRDAQRGEMRTAGLYGALLGPGIKTAGPSQGGGAREGFRANYANFFYSRDLPQYGKV